MTPPPAARVNKPIFAWEACHSQVWSTAPVKIGHRLHEDPLFSTAALERLIETYPRERYQLVRWGGSDGRKGHRAYLEGDIGGLSGKDALEAIRRGRVFLNLRNVPLVDPRYGEVLDAIFRELESYMPALKSLSRTLGILISSPNSKTFYHADLPGQTLWQISGRKRLYLYPMAPPFIRPEDLDKIIMSNVEGLAYEPWYDNHAIAFDLEPGQMLSWPLNYPHRVDNYDCLNVGLAVEYITEDIRKVIMVTRANAILRSKLGLNPQSRSTVGPSFWAKALLQSALRRTPWVKSEDRSTRPPEFRLDPNAPDSVAEISAA